MTKSIRELYGDNLTEEAKASLKRIAENAAKDLSNQIFNFLVQHGDVLEEVGQAPSQEVQGKRRSANFGKMRQVDTCPEKQSFVMIWKNEYGMFSEAFNYNADEDQYYVYDEHSDSLLPQCDTGYTPTFYRIVKDRCMFFVEEDS